MINKTLILFTNTFPYSNGEEFLETEIIFLSERFKQVVIYSYNSEGLKRKLPINVIVKEIKFSKNFNARIIVLKYLFKFITVLKYELLCSKKRSVFFKSFKTYFDTLVWNFNNAIYLKKEIETYNLSNLVLYSYWFGNWGRLLSLVKLLSKKNINFITRIHGYDYDPSRRQNLFIPFRNFEMHQVSKIFSISNYGVNIIKEQYPFYNNIELSRLGVCDNGNNPLNKSNQFHIVSCSSIIELKRVHLIIDILKHISLPIKWTHFGDGKLMDELVNYSKILPSNIISDIQGFKSNSSVIDFYKKEPVDLFINVSSIEGIPVSIMEAISFGIPCVGCNVGGVSEIINENTGFLIDKDFDYHLISDLLADYFRKPLLFKENFRFKVKNFWKTNYNAISNYNLFVEKIN